MGIKGIYGEIGPGERIALAKLAVEKLEKERRPLRIAIDTSIWMFQVQKGTGGSNADIRTLYYRLVRLLRLCVQPLFVFDGPNKPPFKRNKRSTGTSNTFPAYMAKDLLKHFGFPYLSAPGEAEAECALLQREGIVDAVLSEDVDTLMFGCTMSLRNWSNEGVRGNKSPTHVNMYHASKIKASKGLDREGMVLVALMSGGDYIPAGIPNCGVKTACAAASAGFGSDLFKVGKKDTIGINQWRERLNYELRTNESGYFRTRHSKIVVPDNFPDMTIVRYYTNPAVSTPEQIENYRRDIKWDATVDIKGLRTLCADAFDWKGLGGAKHFIRGLAPALLNSRLAQRSISGTNLGSEEDGIEEEKLIRSIHKQRIHITTDGLSELRISYVPAEIVGLDLQKEPIDDHAGLNDSEVEADEAGTGDRESDGENGQSRSISPTKRRQRIPYDPTQLTKEWVLESLVSMGTPSKVVAWKGQTREPKKTTTRKPAPKSKTTKNEMKKGALDQFIKISKPGVDRHAESPKPPSHTSQIATNIPDKRARKPKGIVKPVAASPSRQNISTNPWTLARRAPGGFSRSSSGQSASSIIILSSSPPDTPENPTNKSFSIPPADLEITNSRISQLSYDSLLPKERQDRQPRYHPLQDNINPFEIPSSPPSLEILLGQALSPAQSPQLPPKTSAENVRHTIHSSDLRSKLHKKEKPQNLYVRESLPGAWRALDDEDHRLVQNPTRCLANVEVLDLTDT